MSERSKSEDSADILRLRKNLSRKAPQVMVLSESQSRKDSAANDDIATPSSKNITQSVEYASRNSQSQYSRVPFYLGIIKRYSRSLSQNENFVDTITRKMKNITICLHEIDKKIDSDGSFSMSDTTGLSESVEVIRRYSRQVENAFSEYKKDLSVNSKPHGSKSSKGRPTLSDLAYRDSGDIHSGTCEGGIKEVKESVTAPIFYDDSDNDSIKSDHRYSQRQLDRENELETLYDDAKLHFFSGNANFCKQVKISLYEIQRSPFCRMMRILIRVLA